jgi:glycosyltransferase involved in cell wall biosynthesis
MKIAIDASTISKDKAGIGYYTQGIIEGLTSVDKENSYVLLTNADNLRDFVLPENFQIVKIASARPGFGWILKCTKYLKKNNIDLMLSTSNFMFAVFFPRTFQIVYDLAPISYPQFYSKASSLKYAIQLNFALRRAKGIVTISDTIRREIVDYREFVKNKIFNIGTGISSEFFEKKNHKTDRVSKKYSLPEKFVLSVGTLQPRKNYIGMIRGFAKYVENGGDCDYVIGGGKGWYFDEIFSLVDELGIADRVHFLGYIGSEDRISLYELAAGFMSLSHYEGFGIPNFEAYSRGVPILVSDIPVYREVLKDKAIYVSKDDTENIALGIELMLKQKPKVDFNFLKKHSWEGVAKRLVERLT